MEHHQHHSHEIEDTAEPTSMAGMQMYLHFGLASEEFLFAGLRLDSELKLSLVCLCLFGLSMLLEAVRSFSNIRCRCELNRLLPHSWHLLVHNKPGSCCASGKADSSSPGYRAVEQSEFGPGQASNRTPAGRDSRKHASQDLMTPSCCGSRVGQRLNSHLESAEPYYHCQLGLFKHQSRAYRLGQAFVHFVRALIGTLLMLTAMTYNVCLIFSILAGGALGAYLFHWQPSDRWSHLAHSDESTCP